MTEKGRYQDRSQRRLYPIGALNSWLARPWAAAMAPILSPNQVSLLSLLTSLAGFALIWTGDWATMCVGAGVVYIGLVLDHADGQVARRTGTGSTWGMYLDMIIDRVVEIGLIVSLIPAMLHGIEGPYTTRIIEPELLVTLAMVTLGAMLLWRFATAYNDVLYLRAHLLETGKLPDPEARPKGLAKRPLMPLVFNRDWVILLWTIAIILGNIEGLIVLFLALHTLSVIEKMVVFKVRHKTPEGDANRVLGKDYH